MTETPRHPDLFDALTAAAYLHFDRVTPSPEAARRALERLGRAGKIKPLRLGTSGLLWHRAELDRFIAAEFAALNLDCTTAGKPNPNQNTAGASDEPAPDGYSLSTSGNGRRSLAEDAGREQRGPNGSDRRGKTSNQHQSNRQPLALASG